MGVDEAAPGQLMREVSDCSLNASSAYLHAYRLLPSRRPVLVR